MSKKASKTAILLFNKLKTYYDNRDFVLGVMCNAPHEDDMKAIIEYMEKGHDVTVENLILLSLELGSNREQRN